MRVFIGDQVTGALPFRFWLSYYLVKLRTLRGLLAGLTIILPCVALFLHLSTSAIKRETSALRKQADQIVTASTARMAEGSEKPKDEPAFGYIRNAPQLREVDSSLRSILASTEKAGLRIVSVQKTVGRSLTDQAQIRFVDLNVEGQAYQIGRFLDETLPMHLYLALNRMELNSTPQRLSLQASLRFEFLTKLGDLK
jgi:hypothetical protein